MRQEYQSGNILAVANISILIADQTSTAPNPAKTHYQIETLSWWLIVSGGLPAVADPATVLKKEAVLYIPDRPQPVLESILVGQPVAAKDEEFKTLFSKLLEKLEG